MCRPRITHTLGSFVLEGIPLRINNYETIMSFPEPTTFNGPDLRDMPTQQPAAPAYRCTGCDWTGRGETALRHYRETGHAIRGRNWPAPWPDCQWSKMPIVSVCAWCDPDGTRTDQLLAQGCEVTHGICNDHKGEFEAGR